MPYADSALAVHTQRIQPGVEVYDRCRVRNAIPEYRWKDGEGTDLGYWYVIHFVPPLGEGILGLGRGKRPRMRGMRGRALCSQEPLWRIFPLSLTSVHVRMCLS